MPCPTTPAKKIWNRRRTAGNKPGRKATSPRATTSLLQECCFWGWPFWLCSAALLVNLLVECFRSQLGGQAWLSVDADFVRPMECRNRGAGPTTAADPGPALSGGCNGQRAPDRISLFAAAAGGQTSTGSVRLGGLQRIFSVANLVRLGFGAFKLIAVLAVHAWCCTISARPCLVGRIDPAGTRRANDANLVLDRVESRRRPVDPGDAGLRLPAMAARARHENDAARAARGIEKPRRQSAGYRPTKTNAARRFGSKVIGGGASVRWVGS